MFSISFNDFSNSLFLFLSSSFSDFNVSMFEKNVLFPLILFLIYVKPFCIGITILLPTLSINEFSPSLFENITINIRITIVIIIPNTLCFLFLYI